MKAVVLTCFESDEERMRLVINGLTSEGFEVVAYTSNFSHIRKQYRNNIPEGIRAIDTFSYKRNLSFSRLYSHYSFAKSVFKRVKEGKINVKVLDTNEKWYGVTYKEDKKDLVNAINKMIEEGKYPINLWD